MLIFGAVKKRCSRFQTTVSTRCVRDIKRDFSWKIYGVCCNQENGAEAHYVRVRFISKEKDQVFAPLADLLNSLAAKRFLQSTRREKVHPFGIGFDAGVKSKERCYIISNCAKQTPFLRRVNVQFEVCVSDEWKRIDAMVDRVGFATYKSAPKSSILAASTLDAIRFKDDAYLRFARVTLRFGERSERTILDVGKNFEPQLVYTKTSTILTLNRVRVRTCEGRNVSDPVKTQVRLIFTDMKTSGTRNPLRRNSVGKHCASEAEKALALLKKTVQLACVSMLQLDDELDDDALFEMNIQRVVTNNDFSVRVKGELPSKQLGLYNLFQNSTLFLVPCYDSNGVQLVLQSRDGEFVLRQYVQSPIKFIGSITANCFSGPNFSTISQHGEATEYDGSGKVTYMFETGETDATALVETLVSIIEKLHTFQTSSGRTITAPGTPVPVTAISAVSMPLSLPPFTALPHIPPVPSIHLSRPTTANTYTARTPTTTASGPLTRPPTASTAPTSLMVTPPESVIAPTDSIVPPPLTIFKVPRKPVPASHHSRSVSDVSANSTRHRSVSPTPYRARSPSLQPGRSPSPQLRSPSPQLARGPPPQSGKNLVVPDPSAMPGGRLYELRTRTLKRVITGLDAGLQGTMRTGS